MRSITYHPIGIIHSPFHETEGMPIQPGGGSGIAGTIEIAPQYAAGLKDIDGFSHLLLIYHFHQTRGFALKVKPFMDQRQRGVFATRAPRRPNPIGISVVRLVRRKRNILHIQDLDILDGTPLLDLKPYVPEFDAHHAEKVGWLSGRAHNSRQVKSDRRFK